MIEKGNFEGKFGMKRRNKSEIWNYALQIWWIYTNFWKSSRVFQFFLRYSIYSPNFCLIFPTLIQFLFFISISAINSQPSISRLSNPIHLPTIRFSSSFPCFFIQFPYFPSASFSFPDYFLRKFPCIRWISTFWLLPLAINRWKVKVWSTFFPSPPSASAWTGCKYEAVTLTTSPLCSQPVSPTLPPKLPFSYRNYTVSCTFYALVTVFSTQKEMFLCSIMNGKRKSRRWRWKRMP